MDRPPYQTIALVLQGGGALGAYQAGVMEGLAEAGIEPDWVAGISIGAINSALIAGNPPETRLGKLREFWETVSQPAVGPAYAPWLDSLVEPLGGSTRQAWNSVHAMRALLEGQRGFFSPRGLMPWLNLPQNTGQASFYNTAPLKSTLERLVDFDRINAGLMRLSVSAVNVATGNFEVFDNREGRWRGRIGPEHVMASGALPPGFPAVAIEDPPPPKGRRGAPAPAEAAPRGVNYYWDGGLVSNTPLTQVLDETPRTDTLAFQIDLWSSRGKLPTTVTDAQERMKDIQYSSRTRAVTDAFAQEQRQRRLLRELLARVPPAKRAGDPWWAKAEREACGRCVNVIQLVYQDKEWDGLAKDYEFGPLTMRNHWASGLADLRETLARPEFLARPEGEDPFVTHDLHRPPG